MASAILSIEGGGQPPVEDNPAVIFADYDGTVIDTWTWDNKGSKTELPTVPAHEGLVFEGWNWTLEDIKNDTTGQIITVGPYYHTESGLTEIDVEVNETNGMELQLSVFASNYTSLDWGDGTSIENINYPSHIYEVPGKYTIKISGYSGQSTLYHCNYYGNSNYEVNSYIIKAIRFNSGVNAVGCKGKGIRYITIPKTMIQIKSFANLGCIQLTISENVRSSNSVFEGKKLKYIAMPKNYFNSSGQPVGIGNSAFNGCSSLQSIYIPESIIRIYNSAFKNCSSLKSIYIPESVTSIDSSSFSGCSSLQSISIPNSVTNIDSQAFYDCPSLQSINIPNSVTSIKDQTFKNCSSLQTISIPNSVTSIGNYAFQNCSSLQSINIPNSITSIGGDAFTNCSSLQSINIPNSVTSIGNYAFSNCFSINKAIISSSAAINTYTYIFQNYTTFDFSGCSSIPVLSSSGAIGGGALYVKVIYVPLDLYNEWIKATNWVVFKDKIKPKGSGLTSFSGINRLPYNESATLTATYIGDNEPTDITVTASNPDAIEIGQYTIDAVNKTITIPVTSKNVTDTVTVTLSATFDGKAQSKALSIKIKESFKTPSFTVTDVEGASYNFTLNSNGYYESTNKKVASSAALCKLDITDLEDTSKIIFDCINSGESSYDYGMISKINTTLSTTNSEDSASNLFVNFKGQSSTNVVTKTYPISAVAACFFTLKFRKDGGGDSGNDSLQFKVRFE